MRSSLSILLVATIHIFYPNIVDAQISIGATKEDVRQILGSPVAEYEIGDKEIMGYGESGKIELRDGKVVSITGNFKQPKPHEPAPENTPIISSNPNSAETATETSVVYKGLRKVVFKDSEWSVLNKQLLGKELRSNNQFIPNAKTSGQFIIVKYSVKNLSSKPERVVGAPALVDSKGREFHEHDKQSFFLGDDKKSVSYEQIPPSMERIYHTLYEVAPDSNGIKFQAKTLGYNAETVLLELP